MPFRTIELSDPRFEHDGLRHITVKTPNLAGRGDITVWLPGNFDQKKPLPMVLLLHGVYGSHWAWAHKGGAHLTAARLIQEGRIRPLALVMPSDGLWGDGSGYLPHHQRRFDRWITDDVPQAVSEALGSDVRFSPDLFIAGLSMGGFGALRLAARYSQRFRAAYGLSSITHLDQLPLFVEEPRSDYAQVDPTDESVLALMMKNRDHLPPFCFDCGTDDLLIEHNRLLHQELVKAQIPHGYAEHPGGHEWPYWEEHLTDVLLFFDQHRS
ncbi:esterase family protein [Fibrella sp. HMF5335]|uniref:Esterase family protein n=1 Tax=Fibrella rubiginis TaxID=2817060 RepID=A0A939GKK7_9BACT|nr:alpha/beta hydrolase-fold protein [Fibrella rubiginis]MBO0939568.1 esterase family protein [Fibrella rubiginis]